MAFVRRLFEVFYARLQEDRKEKLTGPRPAALLKPARTSHSARGETATGGRADMTWPIQQGTFEAGDITLQSGARLPAAVLSWKAHGTLSPARDNVIVYPTSYGAQHPDLEWLIGSDKVLDPARWFIVIPDMFGNGLSSSPSGDDPQGRCPGRSPGVADYPSLVTVHANVQAQCRALRTLFGIERVACVYGWSMGALQAYHWAALFPSAVERIVVNCGVSRTAAHNQVFLRSLMATLEAAPQHIGNGRFSAEPRAAKRAFGRIYAAWALSQDFYRAGLHLADGPQPNLGAPDLETFLKTDWEDRFGARPAANLYAQLRTWDAADISANALYDGDLPAALRAIQARVLLMPGATDLYFRVADNAAELPYLRHALLRPIPSIWGHRAGNPVANPADLEFIRAEVRAWLAQ
jgi:homoserine O-acetyltransferase/O-succinyltransferase